MRPASAKAVRSALAIRKTGAQTEDARRPREGEGRRAGGWPDVSRKGEATSGWGKRSKGKEGEGRSACPSRDRRRCSSFPIPAQRGGVRPLRAEASLQGADPRPARVLPRNDARRGSGERRKRRQRRRRCRRLQRGCRWRRRGCRQHAMPPQDAPLQRLPPQRRITTPPPPGTARAPGRGRSALRRALSTAGTRSIPAGRSAP